MYSVEFDNNQPKKYIKKAIPALKEQFRKEIEKIIENPQLNGEVLFGNLAGLYSRHFVLHSVEYRIIYEIKGDKVRILVAKNRENIYKEAARILKKE
ncbi:MAG: type II toxin-antitoxin system RelE/ParE family toxin [Leptospira sp.]|nr:type II toxin-antitoxin system RelE/ParE family toxin [Leptospira sp.]